MNSLVEKYNSFSDPSQVLSQGASELPEQDVMDFMASYGASDINTTSGPTRGTMNTTPEEGVYVDENSTLDAQGAYAEHDNFQRPHIVQIRITIDPPSSCREYIKTLGLTILESEDIGSTVYMLLFNPLDHRYGVIYLDWDEIYKINTAENFLENKEKIDNYIVNTTRWGSKDQVIEYAELLINEPSIGQYKANFLSKVLSRLSRGESK